MQYEQAIPIRPMPPPFEMHSAVQGAVYRYRNGIIRKPIRWYYSETPLRFVQ